MSLGAIQDNLVKTNLVQQTQSRGEEVTRNQEVGQTVAQAEHDRQSDQVVLMSQRREQEGIRDDDEPDRENKKKKKNDEEEPPEKDVVLEVVEEDAQSNAVMHRINIIA